MSVAIESSVGAEQQDAADRKSLLLEPFFNRRDKVAVNATGTPGPVSLSDEGHLHRLVEQHLRGTVRLASYAPTVDGTTRWLCIDCDGAGHSAALADPLSVALAVQANLRTIGLASYLERSGSGSGYHCWVFFEAPCSAADVRKLGLAVVPYDAPLASGGVADPKAGKGIEVFPKQDRISPGGVGNCVYLPFWGSAPNGAGQFYRAETEGLQAFVPREFERVSPEAVRRALKSADTQTATPPPFVGTGKGSESSTKAPDPWDDWKARALSALPLEAIYGDILTGASQGDGWLEARDAWSPSGDVNPSAGVADGTGEARRGSFHSFRSGETLDVFDYLQKRSRAATFIDACRIVAELSGVALPGAVAIDDTPFGREYVRALAEVTERLGQSKDAPKRPFFDTGPEFFERQSEPTPWLLRGLLTDQSVFVVGGEPKTTKTWVGLEMAIALATGTKAFGEFDCVHPGAVVLWLAEDSFDNTQARLCALLRTHGADLAASAERFLIQTRGPQINVRNPEHLALIIASIRLKMAEPPSLLMIDPLRDVHDAVEDKSDDMKVVMSGLRALRDILQCSVLFVHHSAKQSLSTQGRRPGQMLRGSGTVHGSVDGGMYLSNLKTDYSSWWTNNAVVELKAAKGVGQLELTLNVTDDENDRARDATWTVSQGEDAAVSREESLAEDIIAALTTAREPMSTEAIRKAIGCAKPAATKLLKGLLADGRVRKGPRGQCWVLGEQEGANDSDIGRTGPRPHSPQTGPRSLSIERPQFGPDRQPENTSGVEPVCGEVCE